MTYSDYSISLKEYFDFIDDGIIPIVLDEIWEDMTRRIKDVTLRQEAIDKGFELIDDPDREDDVIAEYKLVVVKNWTERLQKYFEENMYYNICCLKD